MLLKNTRKKRYKRYKKRKNKLYLKYVIFSLLILITIITIIIFISYLRFFNKKNQEIPKINFNRTELIDNYLSSFPEKYNSEKQQEKNWLQMYLALKYLPENPNDPLYLELKTKLLNQISKDVGKDLNNIETLFIKEHVNFGNRMVNLNNFIYYFEILGVKNIYLNNQHNWYIKDKIITKKYNISVAPISEINCKDVKTVCMTLRGGYLFFPTIIVPEVRIHLLKNEIRRNLPNVNIYPDDLVIHVRSGNIFKELVLSFYPQPPFCFYEYIISNNKFKNIYIISENNFNPVINKLISVFPNIIFKKNSIHIDISYLCNAYNIVGSSSSFLLESIKLNDNLRKYWEYDIIRRSHKLMFLHQEFYYFPRKFTIYKMKPSKTYEIEMFAWKKTKSQIKLMLEDICPNKFDVIKPNI